jgi:hypothetical protein
MKKFRNSMLALVAGALGFTSCNSDDTNNGDTTHQGEAATLIVNIAPIAPRAAGPSPGSTTTDMLPIQAGVVIVFNEAGTVIGHGVTTAGTGAVPPTVAPIETTTAARRVLFVTNLNNLLTPSNTLAVTTLAQLNALVEAQMSLAGNARPGGASVMNYVVLAGDANVDMSTGSGSTTVDPDGTVNATVNLTIRPISSKLNIRVTLDSNFDTAANIAVGLQPGLLRFENGDGIRVLNAVSRTRVIGNAPFTGYNTPFPWLVPATRSFFAGMSTTGFQNPAPGSSLQAFLADNMNGAGAGNRLFHYYLFENNAELGSQYPTIVTLEATWGFDLDADNTLHFDFTALPNRDDRLAIVEMLKRRKTYFNVFMTRADAGKDDPTAYGTGIQRGKAYEMVLTLSNSLLEEGGDGWFPELPITEIPGGGGGGGTTDPTEEEGDANLTVVVTVQSWVPVTIDKDW